MADVRWRRELAFLLIFAIVVYGAAWAGRLAANLTPVKRPVIQVVKRVEKVERIVYPRPPRRIYPPLNDPLAACGTAPVQIIKLLISHSQDDGDDRLYTWATLRPVGDDYTVQCVKPGDYSFGWKEGDVVVFDGKTVSSE